MTLIERLVENRTFQIIGGVTGLIIFFISMGFLAASRAPIERISTRLEAPVPSNMPILHTLPSARPVRAGINVLTPTPQSEKRTAHR